MVADMTFEQIAALPSEVKGPAVYFLWRGPELLYIGGSTQPMERMYHHECAKLYGDPWGNNLPMPFDRATFLSVPRGWLYELESMYLEKFPTPFNWTTKKARS